MEVSSDTRLYEHTVTSIDSVFFMMVYIHQQVIEVSLCVFFNLKGSHLLSQAVSSQVPSAVQGLTIVFGMGTGVSQGRIAT